MRYIVHCTCCAFGYKDKDAGTENDEETILAAASFSKPALPSAKKVD